MKKFRSSKIVDVLTRQRAFHQQQIELIDLALAAVKAGDRVEAARRRKAGNKEKTHRIQWTRQITGLLDDYTEFTVMDIQNDLVEKRGIPSAQTPQGRNMIINALGRLEKKGLLRRTSPGVFRRIKTPASR